MKTFRQLRGFSQATEFDAMTSRSVRFSMKGMKPVNEKLLEPDYIDEEGRPFIKMQWIGDCGDYLQCLVRSGYQLFVKP